MANLESIRVNFAVLWLVVLKWPKWPI